MTTSSRARVNRKIAAKVTDTDTTQPDETTAVVPTSDGTVSTTHNAPVMLGVIPDDVHRPTLNELRAIFAEESDKENETDDIRGKRNTQVLLFAIANPEHVQVWDEHYTTFENGSGNDKAKREVRSWFADMFGVPSVDNMEAKERKRRIDKIMKAMQFTLGLYRNMHLPHFTFNNAGGVFIANDSVLGRAIYAANTAWSENDTLRKSGADKIMIVDRSTQVQPGRITWPSLTNLVLAKPEDGSDDASPNKVAGNAVAPKIATVSAANIASTFKGAMDLRVANPPSGPNKFNDQKQSIIDGIALIDMALSELPQSEDEQKLFQAFKVSVFKLLNITPKQNGNGATPKIDVATPEAAKELPLVESEPKAKAKNKRNK